MAGFTIDQAMQLAFEHHQAGRLAEAEGIYRQVLAVAPGHADAMHLLGCLAHQAGQFDVAVQLIGGAIQLEPLRAHYFLNLGEAHRLARGWDSALAAFRQAISLQGDFAEAYSSCGIILMELGRRDEAMQAYRKAIELKPDFAPAYSNLGVALASQGRWDEAMAAYRKAIELLPDYPEAHNNLGNALQESGRLEEAVEVLQTAIRLRPAFAGAHYNLGNVFLSQERLDEAIEAYDQAIRFHPEFSETHSNRGIALKEQGLVDEALAAYRKAVELNPTLPAGHSNLTFAMVYDPASSAASVLEEARRWDQRHAAPLRQGIRPHANERSPDRRLKIGYVSGDLRQHPVGRFLLPLLREHDRERFEIFAYADVARPDDVTQELRSHADHWQSIFRVSNERVAEMIREDGIDILVDLAGHTAHNRLLSFARKPAPVQVSYLGYPSTTGLATIDYRLTDVHADPPEWAERATGEYSEKLVRLPATAWCFSAPNEAAVSARVEGPITFGCFNMLGKVTERMLRLWGRLLREAPQATLILKAAGLGSESARRRVRRILSEENIVDDRVELFGSVATVADHLGLYRRVDVALDTFPYHGTMTTLEALWMSVPVVTLAGTTHVSRVGVSLLKNVGLAELVAVSEGEYVQIASELAGDGERLKELRATLRARMEASALMDAAGFAREVERAYRGMWSSWCAGA